MCTQLLKNLLTHPLARGVDIDSPAATNLRQGLIQSKPFLRRLYREWYGLLARHVPAGPGGVLELGSGAGFLREHIPDLITSDVLTCQGACVVLDGRALPFGPETLRAVVMTNVFHHIPEACRFFAEAERCLRPGGTVAMIEPWVSDWSRWVYARLHHEPFEPGERQWEFPSSGPLSGANQALAWMVFSRDRERFAREFPGLTLRVVRPFMPFSYVLSGGVSLRGLAPGWAYPAVRWAEEAVPGLAPRAAMFALVVLEKTRDGARP